MAKLRIKKLHEGVWKIFGFQFNQAVAARDDYQTRMKQRLGQETASEIQRYVDVAIGRYQADDLPNSRIMTMREFYELLALELAVQEIASRIEANALFVDSNGLLPTLGLSWREDILPLINGQQSPGYMTIENVEKFLGMVNNAEQRFPSREEIEGSTDEIADYYRKRRRELVKFLEKAIRLGEPVYCDL